MYLLVRLSPSLGHDLLHSCAATCKFGKESWNFVLKKIIQIFRENQNCLQLTNAFIEVGKLMAF